MRIHRLIPILLLCGAMPCLPDSPAPPSGDRDGRALFFFIQLSDPQLGFYAENKGLAREAANLALAVQHINRLRPKFVVVTGDLIHRPNDQVQAQEYLRIIRTIHPKVPVHSIPGNHDIGDVPTPESIGWFRKTFGPDHEAFSEENWRFLVLNSSLLIQPQAAKGEGEAQRLWLMGELKGEAAEGKNLIVFQHHPWFLQDAAEPDGGLAVPLARRREYLDIIQEAGVKAVFAGHCHACALGKAGDLEMVTSGPVGKPLKTDPSGLRIIWMFKDRIEHRYYALDRVPQEISAFGPGGRRRL